MSKHLTALTGLAVMLTFAAGPVHAGTLSAAGAPLPFPVVTTMHNQFDVELTDGMKYRESSSTSAGPSCSAASLRA